MDRQKAQPDIKKHGGGMSGRSGVEKEKSM